MDKKGQTGLIVGLVFGIASLVIAVIIAFVIVSTLTDANLLTSGRTTTTIENETGILNFTSGTETLDTVADNRMTYTLVYMYGNDTTGTNAYVAVPLVNCTVDTVGVITCVDGTFFNDALITYTYVTQSSEEYSSGLLSGNFSEGIDNVSGKIPTVLLVAAIVLVLGILALLVGVWAKMRMGGSGI